ncbi:MAG: hypothetical protein JST63_12645 [Bacteroidetes bacterium]|nr:hypothetical protein [Bacteroidota bacterium]
MELEYFSASLHQQDPPPAISVYLQALWYDGKGDWHKAHELIQDIDDKKAAWVHAYLHRKEGDQGNAKYWYSRAGKTFPAVSLQQEWEMIVAAFI